MKHLDLVGFRAVNGYGSHICSWSVERRQIDASYLDSEANAISAIHAFGIDGIGIAVIQRTDRGNLWRMIALVDGAAQFVTLSSAELAMSIQASGGI